MTNDHHSPGDPMLCAVTLDMDGNPLGGVTVDIGQIGNDEPLWQITTNSDGRAMPPEQCAYPVEEGRYALRAWTDSPSGPMAYLVDVSGEEAVTVTFRKIDR